MERNSRASWLNTFLAFIIALGVTFLSLSAFVRSGDFDQRTTVANMKAEVVVAEQGLMLSQAEKEPNDSIKAIVKCACEGRGAGSHCKIKGPANKFVWRQEVFLKNGETYDEKYWGEYCERKKPDECLCESVTRFSGALESLEPSAPPKVPKGFRVVP